MEIFSTGRTNLERSPALATTLTFAEEIFVCFPAGTETQNESSLSYRMQPLLQSQLLPQLPQNSRTNLNVLKSQIAKRLGAERAQCYFSSLNGLLSQKLSKSEFNKLCLLTLGRLDNLLGETTFYRDPGAHGAESEARVRLDAVRARRWLCSASANSSEKRHAPDAGGCSPDPSGLNRSLAVVGVPEKVRGVESTHLSECSWKERLSRTEGIFQSAVAYGVDPHWGVFERSGVGRSSRDGVIGCLTRRPSPLLRDNLEVLLGRTQFYRVITGKLEITCKPNAVRDKVEEPQDQKAIDAAMIGRRSRPSCRTAFGINEVERRDSVCQATSVSGLRLALRPVEPMERRRQGRGHAATRKTMIANCRARRTERIAEPSFGIKKSRRRRFPISGVRKSSTLRRRFGTRVESRTATRETMIANYRSGCRTSLGIKKSRRPFRCQADVRKSGVEARQALPAYRPVSRLRHETMIANCVRDEEVERRDSVAKRAAPSPHLRPSFWYKGSSHATTRETMIASAVRDKYDGRCSRPRKPRIARTAFGISVAEPRSSPRPDGRAFAQDLENQNRRTPFGIKCVARSRRRPMVEAQDLENQNRRTAVRDKCGRAAAQAQKTSENRTAAVPLRKTARDSGVGISFLQGVYVGSSLIWRARCDAIRRCGDVMLCRFASEAKRARDSLSLYREFSSLARCLLTSSADFFHYRLVRDGSSFHFLFLCFFLLLPSVTTSVAALPSSPASGPSSNQAARVHSILDGVWWGFSAALRHPEEFNLWPAGQWALTRFPRALPRRDALEAACAFPAPNRHYLHLPVANAITPTSPDHNLFLSPFASSRVGILHSRHDGVRVKRRPTNNKGWKRRFFLSVPKGTIDNAAGSMPRRAHLGGEVILPSSQAIATCGLIRSRE
ncbi:hypothetical protein MUK42_23271 [Musa troglodytarum]|uniref:Uncharacterized protein n=1 Tax=Musa troglodytarum TaxID=320322 RepID=A0A9E7I6G0_9LILI|nr:hypothetical protein MUK42_23271 [Musa troglodytarum]